MARTKNDVTDTDGQTDRDSKQANPWCQFQ